MKIDFSDPNCGVLMMKPWSHLYISNFFPWHMYISVPLSATSPHVWVIAQLSPPGWNRSNKAWRHSSVSWLTAREVLLQEKFGYNISGRKKNPNNSFARIRFFSSARGMQIPCSLYIASNRLADYHISNSSSHNPHSTFLLWMCCWHVQRLIR